MRIYNLWFGIGLAFACTLSKGAKASERYPETYILRSAYSAAVVDVYALSKEDGARVVQWDYNGGTNQQWIFRPVEENFFLLVNKESQKCFEIDWMTPINGARLRQWGCWGGHNQQWSLDRTRLGSVLINRATGKCLDRPLGKAGNDTELIVWDCSMGPNQQWRLRRN